MGETIRPFFWLATTFFLIGFVGFLPFGQPPASAYAAPVAFDPPAEMWMASRPV